MSIIHLATETTNDNAKLQNQELIIDLIGAITIISRASEELEGMDVIRHKIDEIIQLLNKKANIDY